MSTLIDIALVLLLSRGWLVRRRRARALMPQEFTARESFAWNESLYTSGGRGWADGVVVEHPGSFCGARRHQALLEKKSGVNADRYRLTQAIVRKISLHPPGRRHLRWPGLLASPIQPASPSPCGRVSYRSLLPMGRS